MKIDGRFWLTKEGQSFLGMGRIELLEQIDKTGSINAAAKEMKMSYKAAWERINGINDLADYPLIERLTGGKGGGGTKLTPYAHELIATFHRLNELHRQFINRFAEAGDDTELLARILSRTFLTTSARNQLPSTISAIKSHELNTTLTLSLADGDTIFSTITSKSAENMGLFLGCNTYAIIKSSDIQIVKERPISADGINVLSGKITAIETSAENIEITFRLQGKTELVSFMQKKDLTPFEIDSPAYAIIPYNHIIVGL